MILIDSNQHHFHPEVTEKLQKIDEVSIEQLASGDYVCGKIGVEWKEASDFLSSISDNRLLTQARNLKDNFETPIILVVGDVYKALSKTKFHPNSYLGMKATLIRAFNVNVVSCIDEGEAVDLLKILFKQEESKDKSVKPSIVRKPHSLIDRRLSALSCIEGISMRKAKLLLDEFNSLLTVAQKDEWELQHIDGIGKKLAKNIYEFWRK